VADEEPDKLDAQIARESEKLEALNEEAESLVSTTGTSLVPVTQSAEVARQQLAQQRAQAMRMQDQIVKQTKRVEELHRRRADALTRKLGREMERMERMLAPLRERLKGMEEAIWTVSLYLGRNEEIVRLYEGAPAHVNEPIVVRQLVLAMDQECAVASEDGGIDSLDHEKFDAWLQEDWAHVEQVIPEQKAVVACVPRYNSDPKFYENPAATIAAMEGNKQTYFLIRNGRNLYRTWTDFQAGSRLIPKTDEFTRYFRRKPNLGERKLATDAAGYVILEPGSDEWLEAEKAASYSERHYMRVALILEGLLHRTTLFHPLPDVGVSFLDRASHEEGRVRFVQDAERTLGSGELEPFQKWLDRQSAQLRKGMRIVGNFRGQGFQHANHAEDSYTGRPRQARVWPNNADKPVTGAIYRIEDAEPNGDLIIRYAQRHPRYVNDGWGMGGEYRTPKTRARCIIRPGDPFVIPLDLVDVETMERYLASRLERHNYTTMFPVLKAAIRAKRAEHAVEAPFREMMVGVLMRDGGATEAEAREALPGLVDWYKLGNRIHRPLFLDSKDNGATAEMLKAAGVDWDDVELVLADPGTGAPADKVVKLITEEYKRRVKDAQRGHHDDMIAGLRDMHRDALLIARMRSGRYVVLSPEDQHNVHVRERQYTTKLELREDKRWVLPGSRVLRWTVLYESERWAKWDLAATPAEHLTAPERDAVVAEARKRTKGRQAAVTARLDRGKDDEPVYVEVWVVEEGEPPAGAHVLTEPERGKDPAIGAVGWVWERKGGEVVVKPQRDYYGGSRGSVHYSWSEKRGHKPWRMDGAYGRHRELVWEDETGEALEAFFAAKERHREARKQVNALGEIVERAQESIERQWLKPRYDDVWRRFLEDFADPGLWEGHRKANRDLLPKFERERDAAWIRALEALVEAGELPWGKTVREVVELAQSDPQRFNYQWDTTEQYRAHEYEGGARTWSAEPDQLLPREEWITELDEDIADLTFIEGYELELPWPTESEDEDEEEDDDYCEDCGQLLDDCVCDDDEPELGEDYDVEGVAEEGIAALPPGDAE
jgi:hypothetical protein